MKGSSNIFLVLLLPGTGFLIGHTCCAAVVSVYSTWGVGESGGVKNPTWWDVRDCGVNTPEGEGSTPKQLRRV